MTRRKTRSDTTRHPAEAPPRPATGLGLHYTETSSKLWVSLMFIVPLMGLYEVAITASQAELNNAVNSALKLPFLLMGRHGIMWFNALLIGAFFWVGCRHEDEGGEIGLPLFSFMLVESVGWGVLLSMATLLPLNALWPNSLSAPIRSREFLGITLSVGAGIYEEILFRHLLGGLLYKSLVHSLGWRGRWESLAVVVSLLLSAAAFSGMHYLGPCGDVYTLPSFLFRFGAGIALGLLYFTRGLGITVYAHATYDVLLVLGLV